MTAPACDLNMKEVDEAMSSILTWTNIKAAMLS